MLADVSRNQIAAERRIMKFLFMPNFIIDQNCQNHFKIVKGDFNVNIKSRRAMYPLKNQATLHSRENAKNGHQSNGIQMNEQSIRSSFTKCGVVVCVLFILVVTCSQTVMRSNKSNLFHGETTEGVESNSVSHTKEISFKLQAKSLSGEKQPDIFVRQSYSTISKESAHSHDFVLIFLHGAAYSSATWSELGILKSLAQHGYISYALDVPGYGQSVKVRATDDRWLRDIIDQLIGTDEKVSQHIVNAGGISTLNKKYILVTASMSGIYAMPLLIERVKNMVGMITVAPVSTDKFGVQQLITITIPVCIIYGELDTHLGEKSKANLIKIPNHKLIMVPGGEHAAYKTDPKFFELQVLKWLSEVFN
eukprot:2540_1